MTPQKTGRGIESGLETERPRERLLREGAESLSDAQLLAILLRVGRQEARRQSRMEVLVRRRRWPRPAALQRRGASHSRSGPCQGCAVEGGVEVGKRAVSAPLTTGTRISSSADLFKHYHARLRDLRHEIFAVVLLTPRTVIRDVTISEGQSDVEHRASKGVLFCHAWRVCRRSHFLHNHPSGDPTPSQEDRVLTARLVSAGSLLGIQVLDHLIVGTVAMSVLPTRVVEWGRRWWYELRRQIALAPFPAEFDRMF